MAWCACATQQKNTGQFGRGFWVVVVAVSLACFLKFRGGSFRVLKVLSLGGYGLSTFAESRVDGVSFSPVPTEFWRPSF